MTAEIPRRLHQDVDNAISPLDLASNGKKYRPSYRWPEPLVDLGTEDQIRNARFVLDGHEDDSLGGRRTLSDKHEPGDPHALACRRALFVTEMAARDDARLLKSIA
jgi:hypothetical protein